MPTIEGKVERVSQKDGSYGVMVGGKWYNSFGECPTKKGDTVHIDFIKKGIWNNINTIDITEEAKETAQAPTQSLQDYANLMNECIEITKNLIGQDAVEEHIYRMALELFRAMTWRRG